MSRFKKIILTLHIFKRNINFYTQVLKNVIRNSISCLYIFTKAVDLIDVKLMFTIQEAWSSAGEGNDLR